MRSYKKEHHNPKRIPYGWRIASSGYHMVDGSARKIILKIVCMRNQGLTFQKIKEILENQDLPSPRNGTWHCATIRKIFNVNLKSLPRVHP